MVVTSERSSDVEKAFTPSVSILLSGNPTIDEKFKESVSYFALLLSVRSYSNERFRLTSRSKAAGSLKLNGIAEVSKVLISAHATFQVSGGTATQTIYRGSTQLASGGGSGTNSFAGMELASKHYPMMINFLDSPNTTSETTYKLMQLGSGGETIYYNPSTVNSAVMTLMEIGA